MPAGVRMHTFRGACLLLFLRLLSPQHAARAQAPPTAAEVPEGPPAVPTAAPLAGSGAPAAASMPVAAAPADELAGWVFSELPAVHPASAPGAEAADLPEGVPDSDAGGWAFTELPASPAPPAAGAAAPAAEPPLLPAPVTSDLGPPPGGAPAAASLLPSPLPPLPPQQMCWAQDGLDYSGADLLSKGAATVDAGACCRMCWDTPGCGAWTYRDADNLCWVKSPAGWSQQAANPNMQMTSGLVTALTLQAFTPPPPPPPTNPPGGAEPPAQPSGLLPPDMTPLFSEEVTWQPPPEGFTEGKCMVLPQSNANGSTVQELFNTSSAAACCDACAADVRCTVWVYCPIPTGCNNGFGNVYPGLGCGLRHQTVAAYGLTDGALSFNARGHADVGAYYPPGYTVPFVSGFVQRKEPSCVHGVPCEHTLSSGELLSDVSAAYGVPLDALLLLNFWISDASRPYPKQTIRLPCCPAPGMGIGVIIGIVAGILVALALVAGFLLWRRRKRRRQQELEEEDAERFGQKVGATFSELDAAWRNGKHSPCQSGSMPGAAAAVGQPSSPKDAGGSLLGAVSSLSGSLSGAIPDLPFASGLLTPSDYTIETDPSTGKKALLGSGHFGNVYRGTCGLEPAAIKVIKDPAAAGSAPELDRQQLLREVSILKSCRSQHLVAFLGAGMNEEEFVIVTELLRGGTLYRALKAGKVTWYRRGCRIAIDVAYGLDYLHRRNIIHLDLKSPNVLLTEHGRAKVADVGLARIVPNTQSCLSSDADIGTFPWAAPEQLMGQRCTVKADIYAFGTVLWEICTGQTPVRGHMREVRVPEECPKVVADLIAACMAPQPEQRPSAEEIIKTMTPLLTSVEARRMAGPARSSSASEAAGRDSGGKSSGQAAQPSGPAELQQAQGQQHAPSPLPQQEPQLPPPQQTPQQWQEGEQEWRQQQHQVQEKQLPSSSGSQPPDSAGMLGVGTPVHEESQAQHSLPLAQAPAAAPAGAEGEEQPSPAVQQKSAGQPQWPSTQLAPSPFIT